MYRVMHPGQFVWNDLVSPSPAASQRFYQELFGWWSRTEGGHLIMAASHRQGVTQVCAIEPGEWPHWRPYIDVTDLDAHLALVEKAGGRVAKPAAPHPLGRYAVISDPSGGIYAAVQLSGRAPAAAPIAPGLMVWHQLMTTSLDKALPFYQAVFGWERHGPPGWHAFVGEGGTDLGVISQEPEPRGSAWIGYVQVEDVTGATARAVALGAEVVFPPRELAPLGHLSVLLDPNGVSFGLINRTVGQTVG